MKPIKTPYIDWNATADNLKLLRCDNIPLRRHVCNALGTSRGNCGGDCDKCTFDMDMHVSQKELARVMGVTEHMIINWESGRSKPRLEYLLMYAMLCETDFTNVIVLARSRTETRERD
ncbi:MAG: helix-turn-helix transcriptional regulator [Clostridia bacterium]|nr:helix-turn-helix transcriptional regulator [Clostridia bacterium]